MINIVLYHPEIAANCGNIVRTCQAINAELHLIKPLGFSLDEKSFLRAGMDYILDCPIHVYDNVEEFYQKNPGAEIYYITRYGQKVFTSVDVSSPVKDYFFMFGAESTGIDYEILRDHLDHCLRIPMKANARSLNLSNCVAIVSYEAMRQQNYFDLSTYETFKGQDFLNEFDK